MLCPECHNEVPDDARVCSHCNSDIQTARRLLSDYAACVERGLLDLRSNRIGEAISSFREAVRLVSGLGQAHFLLGIAHAQLGHYELALDNLRRVPQGHALSAEAGELITRITSLLNLRRDLLLPDDSERRGATLFVSLDQQLRKNFLMDAELSLRMLEALHPSFENLPRLAEKLANLRAREV